MADVIDEPGLHGQSPEYQARLRAGAAQRRMGEALAMHEARIARLEADVRRLQEALALVLDSGAADMADDLVGDESGEKLG